MDDKLKKFLKTVPFFKKYDLEDPTQYHKVILYCVASILLLVSIIFLNYRKSHKHPQNEIDTPQKTISQEPLLDMPDAADNEYVLSNEDMLAAHSTVKNNNGRPGVRNIFDDIPGSEKEQKQLDALAEIEQENKANSPTLDSPQSSSSIEQRRQHALDRLGLSDDDSSPKRGSSQRRTPASSAEQRKEAIAASKGTANDVKVTHGNARSSSPEEIARKRREQAIREEEQEDQQSVTTVQSEEKTNKKVVIEQKKQPVRRSGGISSLDRDFNMSDGISSLDDDYSDTNETELFKVMFIKDERVASGQRIRLRLLDDMPVGSIIIPRNTHLSAIASIGERMDITVQSLEINGHIITINCEAYDNDGIKGLYFPTPQGAKNTQNITKEATNLASSSLGNYLSAIPGVAGLASNIASSALKFGVNVATDATNKQTTTATTTSGYTFFLVKK